jgi:hypothetical protein
VNERRVRERIGLFVRAFLSGPEGTRGVAWKSAGAAGYRGSPRTLSVTAAWLLKDPRTHAALTRYHEKEDLTVARWVQEVKRLAYGTVDEVAAWDHEGGLVVKPSATLDRDALATIREVVDETTTRFITEEEFVVEPGTPPLKRGRKLRVVKPGEPPPPPPTPETRLRRREEVVDRRLKVKQHDKIEALKLLGRFHEIIKDHPVIQVNIFPSGVRRLGDEELIQLARLEAKALGTVLPEVFDLPAEDVVVEPLETPPVSPSPRYPTNGDGDGNPIVEEEPRT